jgi:hypothetical protein
MSYEYCQAPGCEHSSFLDLAALRAHQREAHGSIDKAWTPTAENVNALPDPLRSYIHQLETRCDPSGELRELVLLREENAMLRGVIGRLDREDGSVDRG